MSCRLALMFAFVLCSSVLAAQQDIRQVDFKNFTYPLSGHLLGHESLEWLGTPSRPATNKKMIHLIEGSQLTKTSSVIVDGKEYGQYEGFTLQSISYGDVVGDGREEAIVTLLYQSGGTQTTNYVYIYDLIEHDPKLLAYCHSGDRSHSGLYGVSAIGGLLVFELLDPARESADCCSSGVLISSYKWYSGVFNLTGPVKRRALPLPDPQAPMADLHEFRVDITLSEKAKKSLVANRETVVVVSYFTGTPRKSLPLKQYKQFLSRPGPLGLGESEVEVGPGEIAIFRDIRLNREALAQVDSQGPQLLINIVSGRKSSKDNLLQCDIYEGSLTSADGATIPVTCGLIRE